MHNNVSILICMLLLKCLKTDPGVIKVKYRKKEHSTYQSLHLKQWKENIE